MFDHVSILSGTWISGFHVPLVLYSLSLDRMETHGVGDRDGSTGRTTTPQFSVVVLLGPEPERTDVESPPHLSIHNPKPD